MSLGTSSPQLKNGHVLNPRRFCKLSDAVREEEFNPATWKLPLKFHVSCPVRRSARWAPAALPAATDCTAPRTCDTCCASL